MNTNASVQINLDNSWYSLSGCLKIYRFLEGRRPRFPRGRRSQEEAGRAEGHLTFASKSREGNAADEILNWQGLLIGAFVSDFLTWHGFAIVKKRS